MVEPKLTLFKMQIKSCFRQSSKLCQAHFSNAPEVFDTVDVRLFISKFIGTMLNSVMLFIPQVHKAIVASPTIGVDRAFKVYFTLDHRL